MRCGRTNKTALIRVVARPTSNPSRGPERSNEPSPRPPASPKPTPGMSYEQLDKIYDQVCPGNLHSSVCLDTINLIMPVYYQRSMKDCDWFWSCDPVNHPYGNPFDTSSGRGICYDWVAYKRHDIIEKVRMTWYRQWLMDGKPLPEGWTESVDGKVVRTGTYPSIQWYGYEDAWKDNNGWTTWAKKAGFQVDNTPSPGAVMVSYGHAAYVESMKPGDKYSPYGWFVISEMNYGGHRGEVHYDTFPANPRLLAQMKALFVH